MNTVADSALISLRAQVAPPRPVARNHRMHTGHQRMVQNCITVAVDNDVVPARSEAREQVDAPPFRATDDASRDVCCDANGDYGPVSGSLPLFIAAIGRGLVMLSGDSTSSSCSRVSQPFSRTSSYTPRPVSSASLASAVDRS